MPNPFSVSTLLKAAEPGDAPAGGGVPAQKIARPQILDAPEPASFGAYVKSGFVDDPGTKENIFAASRFPDLPPKERQRGYMTVGGEVMRQGEDGNLYRETPDTALGKAKRFAGELVASVPAMALGTAGEVLAGPPGAAGGAALGEGVRKAIGGLVFDEPQSAAGYAVDMGAEALLGGLGTYAGRGLARMTDKARNLGMSDEASRLARAARRDLPVLDQAAADAAYAQGKEFGIDLMPHQTTQSRELVSRFNLLGDLPRTQNMVAQARQAQQEQVQRAVYDYLGTLAPDETGARSAGSALVDAAQGSMRGLKDARTAAATPLYNAARGNASPVDTSAAMGAIDDMMSTAPRGGKSTGALEKIKGMLMREVPGDNGETALVPENRLAVLDNVKKEIDALLDGPDARSVDRDTLRRIGTVRDSLVQAMDQASPEYAQARRVFAEASPPVVEAQKGLVGQVSKMEGDRVTGAARTLFSNINSSPETVAKARQLIRSQNPEAWEAALRVHIQDVFEGLKDSLSTGEVTNLGGRMQAKLFGDQRQRSILRASMSSEQFQTLTDFMEVLRRTGLGMSKESVTATRQEATRDMRQASGSRLANTVLNPRESLLNSINDGLFGKYQESLAKAMIDPSNGPALVAMKRMKAGSRQQLEAMGAFMAVATGDTAGNVLERATTPNTANPNASGAQTPGRIKLVQ